MSRVHYYEWGQWWSKGEQLGSHHSTVWDFLIYNWCKYHNVLKVQPVNQPHKRYRKEHDHKTKFMRSLSQVWDYKLTAIKEIKDLYNTTFQSLCKNLCSPISFILSTRKTLKLSLTVMPTKKEKRHALKVSENNSSKTLHEEDDNNEDVHDEKIAFFTRKLKKFWRKDRPRTFKKFTKSKISIQE